jgi:hypothetical protein
MLPAPAPTYVLPYLRADADADCFREQKTNSRHHHKTTIQPRTRTRPQPRPRPSCLIIASACANCIPVIVGNCEPQRAQLRAHARSKQG